MYAKVSLSLLALATATTGAQLTPFNGRVMAPVAYATASPDLPRAVIGVNTAGTTGARDTLGLLVSSVTRNSPAEKAGIEEGSRIASINGVNLRLAASDVGDPDMERLMGRRLTRELDKLKVGDEVELKVYSAGQTKTVKVKTVDPDSLYNSDDSSMRRRSTWQDRATLGIGIGSNGSKRDSLGIFVTEVDDDGPAAKAGLVEGARIASINGVDVRVAREDAGDGMVSATRVARFERELGKVKSGDAVELKVYQDGQSKMLRITSVSQGDYYKNRGAVYHTGPVTIIRSPDAASINIDAAQVAATARRAAETAVTVAGRAIDGFRGISGTISW